MGANNSYDRYRQYRKNRRRYEASVGAVFAIILLVILANILPMLKGIFICLIAVLAPNAISSSLDIFPASTQFLKSLLRDWYLYNRLFDAYVTFVKKFKVYKLMKDLKM